jgi:hypothetical protein
MAHAKARQIHIWDETGADVSAFYKNTQITPEESEDSFASHAAMRDGTANDWSLGAEVAEDAAPTAPWSLMQDLATRGSEYTFIYSAFTDDPANFSATTPGYQATAIITLPSGSKFMGDESTRSPKKVPTVEIEWPLVDEPVKLTAPPVFPLP